MEVELTRVGRPMVFLSTTRFLAGLAEGTKLAVSLARCCEALVGVGVVVAVRGVEGRKDEGVVEVAEVGVSMGVPEPAGASMSGLGVGLVPLALGGEAGLGEVAMVICVVTLILGACSLSRSNPPTFGFGLTAFEFCRDRFPSAEAAELKAPNRSFSIF